MPRDTSIKSVLVIGSGPIVIGQACEFDPASPAELTQKQLMFAQTQQAVDWQYQALSVDHWHLLIWPNTVNRSLCLAFQHAHFSPSWLTEHPLFDSLLRQIGYHFQLQKTNLTLRQKKHAKQAFAAKAQLQQEQETTVVTPRRHIKKRMATTNSLSDRAS